MTTTADRVTYLSVPAGASVLVYGSRWTTHRGLGTGLAPLTTPIPLPLLCHGTTVEEVHA
jgi:hypothetical protein